MLMYCRVLTYLLWALIERVLAQDRQQAPLTCSPLSGHYYRIRSKAHGTYLDLYEGRSASATKIQCWEKNPENADMYNQLWRIEFVSSFGDKCTYTLINLRGGTYADLVAGDRDWGTPVQGYPKDPNGAKGNQYWDFTSAGDDYYQYVHS